MGGAKWAVELRQQSVIAVQVAKGALSYKYKIYLFPFLGPNMGTPL